MSKRNRAFFFMEVSYPEKKRQIKEYTEHSLCVEVPEQWCLIPRQERLLREGHRFARILFRAFPFSAEFIQRPFRIAERTA